MRCDCRSRFCRRRTGIIIGPSSLGEVTEYGLSLFSSSIEVSVVAAVGLLAKIGVLEGVLVGDVDSAPWFEFMKTVRIGRFSEEFCEVEGGDVWSSVWLDFYIQPLSCFLVQWRL
jgi:hypothetical protein